MPETFPTWDAEARALVDTEYFNVDEIAELFHVSVTKTRKLIADEHWPHLEIAGRIYMTGADIGDAIHMMRRGPIPEKEGPPTLGVPLTDPWLDADEREGFR